MDLSSASRISLEGLRIADTASRTQVLYENFKNRILSGELKEGSVLPNENEMCQILQVGRSTLRETYQMLATNGLIRRSKTGTVINDREQIIAAAPFSIAAELASPEDIFTFRVMFEAESARCAADRATADELRALGGIVDNSRSIQTIEGLREADLQFHRAVVEFSHNPLLVNLFPSVWASFQGSLIRNYARLAEKSHLDTIHAAVEHHSRVYRAIAAKDPDGASIAMQQHLLIVYER